MTTKPKRPDCPKCSGNRTYQPFPEREPTIWRCHQCTGVEFEPDNEGGDYSDRNPAARLEREERRRAQS